MTKHTTQTPFKVDGLDKLPKVGVVYQHAGVEGVQAQALVDAKYDGIVTAGVGNGNLHKSTFPIIEKAAKNGIAIVRSSRVPTGSTTKDAEVDDAKYGFGFFRLSESSEGSCSSDAGINSDQRSERNPKDF